MPKKSRKLSACGAPILYKSQEKLVAEHNGKIYYFCTPACLNRFKEDPEAFLKSKHYKIG